MRFLVRLMMLVSLAGLAFRALRMLAFSRQRSVAAPPAPRAHDRQRRERIEDANFTDIDSR